MITISLDVHAKTGNEPHFSLHRQKETGTLVLRISNGAPETGLNIYLDDNTHDELLIALYADDQSDIPTR